MKTYKSIYLKLIRVGEYDDVIIKPGDSIQVRIKGEIVPAEVCCITTKNDSIDEENTNLVVRSRNNVYVLSLLDVAKVFAGLYTGFKSLNVCYDLFLIDDFNNDPISIGEECLLLEPSIDPDKKFNTYKAVLKDIKYGVYEFNIRYEGEKKSVDVDTFLCDQEYYTRNINYMTEKEHYCRFLVKKINKEKDNESI